ncbi:MAG: hypothetical protein J5637_01295, partial [Prevotella sp.]|nr:hypothetical protein [Prevotella sp.]
VAAGMRRIEAVTAEAATAYADRQQEQIIALNEMFKGTKDLAASIAKLQEENGQLKIENSKLKIQNSILSLQFLPLWTESPGASQ